MNPPPPFFSFRSDTDFLAAAGPVLSAEEMNAVHAHIGASRPPVSSLLALSLLTGFSQAFLVSMAARPERHYRRFEIRKGAGIRVIHSPRVGLKSIQKWFGWHLARSVELPTHVHGFVPNRSTITAAKVHCGASWVGSVDVADFFGSVSVGRVEGVLDALGYCIKARRILVPLLTLGNALPQGSPASPVLANLAFADADHALAEWADRENFRITRYADDIAVSGPTAIERHDVCAELQRLVEHHDWRVNEAKSSFVWIPDRCRVLGLCVGGDQPRLPKRMRNRVRGLRRALERDGELKHTTEGRRFCGLVSYASSIENG